MQVTATAKWIRTGPRKMRQYADLVRYEPLGRARALLSVHPSPSAKTLLRCLNSAVANAENNHNLDVEDLRIGKLCIDEATRIPRLRPRARGRADQYHHRMCHITVVVTDEAPAGAPAKPAPAAPAAKTRRPAAPAKAGKPAAPAKTGKPAAPAKAGKSATPAKAGKSAVPAKVSKQPQKRGGKV